MNSALEVMKKRRSIRRYSNRDVHEEVLDRLLLAAMWAPTARNRRHCEFVVVRDNEMKNRLASATQYSGMCAGAGAVIVVLGDMEITEKWIEDCAVAAEHISLAAVSEGLGTCWVQLRANKHANMSAEDFVKELLAIPSRYGALCMIAVGYPDEEKNEHSVDEFDRNRVHFEAFL